MGKKAAVLIGCNYPGTKAELKGCVNDVQRARRSLVESMGFADADISVLIDTDDAYMQPTGANIRRSINRLLRSARPGDELFVHYSGHGARLPVDPDDDDSTGYHECIVPCDMNLIIDEDFREFVDKLPDGCRLTIVADSCNSGGLIENAKEQIGESTTLRQQYKNGTGTDDHKQRFVDVPAGAQLHRGGDDETQEHIGRALPLPAVIDILSRNTGREGIDEGSIRSTISGVFGEAASPRLITPKTNGEGEGAVPPQRGGRGILISACQSEQNAADAKPVMRPEGAFGALSNAIERILFGDHERSERKTVTNRELVKMARDLLAKQGFMQRPGLYCSDDVADEPFLS